MAKLELVIAGHKRSSDRLATSLYPSISDTEQSFQFESNEQTISVLDHAGVEGFTKRLTDRVAGLSTAILATDDNHGLDQLCLQHAFLLTLCGINELIIVVTGLKDTHKAEEAFSTIKSKSALLGWPKVTAVAIGSRGLEPPAWFDGPELTATLRHIQLADFPIDVPLRMPIRRTESDKSLYSGHILTGLIEMGDTLLFSPSNQTARVVALNAIDENESLNSAEAGREVTITLDSDLEFGNAELASHVDNPPLETDVFRARIAGFSSEVLNVDTGYSFYRFGHVIPVSIQSVERVTDDIGLDNIFDATIRASEIIALDPFEICKPTGSLILNDGENFIGAGQINMRGYADQRDLITVRSTNVVRVEHSVTDKHRAKRNGHRGGVLWLTGLSGAGKSTIAIEVEKRLFAAGYQAYVLDGDNVRHGLNSNLGFSPEDRAENIRRVGEVGALFAGAGFITITAFISPYRSDRERARTALPDGFHEVYVKADLEACEKRDPKGLYKKARAGEIPEFTGISAPYEVPKDPELTIDTSDSSVDECAQKLIEHIEHHFVLHDK
tara:strand:+ start:1604 stop:3271 length:1668 start_codon:yes stop_codon:yes gene_type:complete